MDTCASILVTIASGFTKLFAAIKLFTGINIAAILTNPFVVVTAAAAGLFFGLDYYIKKSDEARKKIVQLKQEIRDANFDVEYDFQFNMKTGFENLPEAWSKANEDTKEALRTQKVVLQEDFIGAYQRAINWVKEKMPEYSDALSSMGDEVNEKVLKQLSDFLHGNVKEFYNLSDPLKAVAERLHDTFYIEGEHNI